MSVNNFTRVDHPKEFSRALNLPVNSGSSTFGGSRRSLILGFEMFSAKKPRIDGPCPWPDHGDSATECRQGD